MEKKGNIPLNEERVFLTLSSQPSQSILTLSSTVCDCFLFLCLCPLLIKSDKYSKVPPTPILWRWVLRDLKTTHRIWIKSFKCREERVEEREMREQQRIGGFKEKKISQVEFILKGFEMRWLRSCRKLPSKQWILSLPSNKHRERLPRLLSHYFFTSSWDLSLHRPTSYIGFCPFIRFKQRKKEKKGGGPPWTAVTALQAFKKKPPSFFFFWPKPCPKLQNKQWVFHFLMSFRREPSNHILRVQERMQAVQTVKNFEIDCLGEGGKGLLLKTWSSYGPNAYNHIKISESSCHVSAPIVFHVSKGHYRDDPLVEMVEETL